MVSQQGSHPHVDSVMKHIQNNKLDPVMQQRVDAAQIMTTSALARKHYKEQEEIYMR